MIDRSVQLTNAAVWHTRKAAFLRGRPKPNTAAVSRHERIAFRLYKQAHEAFMSELDEYHRM